MSKNYKDSEIANPFTDMKPAPETGTSMTAEEGASMIFGGAPTPPVSNTTPALVRLDDSTYSYKRFTLTGKGLAFPDGISLEEADELGHILATLDTHVSLWQGDWANIYVALETAEKGTKLSDQETGRVYIRLADDFSINPKTLKNRASVCRKVPVSRRRDTLTLSYYAEVTTLDSKLQAKLLESADLEGWSVRTLREKVQLVKHHQQSLENNNQLALFDRKPVIKDYLRLYRSASTGDQQAKEDLLNRVEEARDWLDDIETDLNRMD